MALKTPNLKLVKLELTDSPPDITDINPNWDALDELAASAALQEGHLSEWKDSTISQDYSWPWRSVAYGDGRYVAVADGSYVGYSDDGLTWEMGGEWLDANKFNAVTFGKGIFVAVGRNKVGYSADGVTWSYVTPPTYGTWKSIAYGNGLFVAVGEGSSNTGLAMYSTDGSTWTMSATNPHAGVAAVAYGNGRFVAVGDPTAADRSNASYSTDGVDWTTIQASALRHYHSIVYGNNKFLAISPLGNCMYSEDGTTWAESSLPAPTSGKYWNGLTYGGDLFLAVGSGDAKIAYSADGINWVTDGANLTGSLNAVVYGDGFVAVGDASKGAAADLTFALKTSNGTVLPIAANIAVDIVIAPTDWAGSGPWTYTLANPAIAKKSPVYMSYQNDPSDDVIAAVQGANIVHKTQSQGSLTIQALAAKPTIALPLQFVIGGGK